jgi:secreted Zn-dependent insulinase-like peptidase
MAQIQVEYNSDINDYSFRSLLLPNGMKVLLISAAKDANAIIGVKVKNTGKIETNLILLFKIALLHMLH